MKKIFLAILLSIPFYMHASQQNNKNQKQILIDRMNEEEQTLLEVATNQENHPLVRYLGRWILDARYMTNALALQQLEINDSRKSTQNTLNNLKPSQSTEQKSENNTEQQ